MLRSSQIGGLGCKVSHQKILYDLQVCFKLNNYFKGVITQSMVGALSELCSLFLKGGNSAFIAAIANGLFPQNEYQSRE